MTAPLLVTLAMAADLLSWVLVPEPVRAMESNALVPYVSPLVLKVGAVLTIVALLRRLTTRSPKLAVRLVVVITAIGVGSNLTGLVG